MTDQEFKQAVKDELTVACGVPLTVRDKELDRIIEWTEKWFHRNYEDAVESRYYGIPVTAFQTAEFRQRRTVPMPACVISVTGLKKLREDVALQSTFDGAELSVERVLLNDITTTGEATENLMYYVMNLYWADTVSQVLNHTVSFNYNRNTRKLFIGGETPERDLVAVTDVTVPREALYEDELFYRYVVAVAKAQLARLLGTFNYQLPGGVTINYDLLREEGRDTVQAIKEEIKGNSSMDFFLMSGSW